MASAGGEAAVNFRARMRAINVGVIPADPELAPEHEGGHIFILRRYGVHIESACALGDLHSSHLGFVEYFVDRYGLDPLVQAQVCVAGGAAETVELDERTVSAGCYRDFERAWQALSIYEPRQRIIVLRRLFDETQELLDRNWRAIEHIADEIAGRCLGRREIAAMLGDDE